MRAARAAIARKSCLSKEDTNSDRRERKVKTLKAFSLSLPFGQLQTKFLISRGLVVTVSRSGTVGAQLQRALEGVCCLVLAAFTQVGLT